MLAAGLFFSAVAGMGVLRLPDFYTRLHALGKAETLGMLLMLGAVALWQGLDLTSAKVLLVALFLFLTSPTATHVMARAAFRRGVKPLTNDDRERP